MAMSPQALLDALDPQQREAAEALHGPVCILAGAGTGKTRAITHRIAYGVATGEYDPLRVMALTFTTKAAGEMRTRLADLGAGAVHTRTFHSAALSQLSYFWPRVLGTRVPELVAGKLPLVADAAGQLQLRLDTATLRDLAGEIEWRKARSLTMEEYGATAQSRPMPGGLPVGAVTDVMTAYERIKDQRRQMDFEDVLLATAGMLAREPSVSQQVREQYRHFTVDEYQDASPAQTQLLELWLGRRNDVCVVGDPNQTIYSFAGADSTSLARFRASRQGVRVVELVRSYRSQSAIVEAANSLVQASDRSPLQALTPQTHPVETLEAPTDAGEAASVAARITAWISEGAKTADIAVLVRFHAQSAAIVQSLRSQGISVRTEGSAAFFQLPVVRRLILVFRAGGADDRPLFQQVVDLAQEAGWSTQAPEGRGAERAEWDAVQALVTMAEEAAPGTSLADFATSLMRMAEAEQQPRMDAVTIATIHAAKGLEWENVVVVGLSEGLLPISYAKTDDAVEEERRLLYVAITRARSRLLLTRSASSGATRRIPSRFLRDLPASGTRTQGRAAGGGRSPRR